MAHLEEALELRNAGLSCPLVLLFGLEPSAVAEVVHHNLTPVIWSVPQAEVLSAEASRTGRRIPVHIKLDTGMGRVGLLPEAAVGTILQISGLPGIAVEGLSSHFSDAELENPAVVQDQVGVFTRVSEGLAKEGVSIPLKHMANSAAVIRFPTAHFDMVRPGLMLYGYSPAPDLEEAGLRPAMRVSTRVIAIKRVSPGTPISYGRTYRTSRESLIATLSVGYADGYSRALSNKGRVLVGGTEVPVVGRVCMDLTMVDVTEAGPVQVGDEAILIGESENTKLWADRVAELAGTIPYEILTSVGRRVRRVYHEG